MSAADAVALAAGSGTYVVPESDVTSKRATGMSAGSKTSSLVREAVSAKSTLGRRSRGSSSPSRTTT